MSKELVFIGSFLVLVGVIILNFSSVIRFVGVNLYSHYYHYKNCSELPSYDISKKEFDFKKEKIVEFLGTKNLQVSKNIYNNGSIRIKLEQVCDTKAQIEIDILSDEQRIKVQEFLQKELPSIPANITKG